MVKNYLIPVLILLVTIAAGCVDGQEKQITKEQQDSLMQVQKDSMLNLFQAELEAISSKVNEVNASNGIFSLDTTENKVLSKETIISQVENLDLLLDANQKQLQDLFDRMKASKVANEKLTDRISGMMDRLARKETQIDDLLEMLANKDMQIDQILGTMDSMRVYNIELTEEVILMDEAMHLVYYVVGESKELKEQGIVAKEGGILGIGSSKKLDVGQLDKTLFTEVDQRDLISVPLFSKKAKLITNHPEASYELIKDQDGGVESLSILNRKSFWTATDYLVIEVSN